MYNPVSTYRIQFNKSFTLKDLENIIEYIDLLGVGSIYASPVFKAMPGSNHGYDVADPGKINPELGTIEDLSGLKKLLDNKKIGWIQDIVPNHMAYSTDNKWINDVLEKGPDSDYFMFFDTEPAVTSGMDKIMLPFLGNETLQIIGNHELHLILNQGNLAISYYDNIYPACYDSFRRFFTPLIDNAPESFRLIWENYDLRLRVADKSFLNGEWELVKKEFFSLYTDDLEMKSFIEDHLKIVNDNPALLGDYVFNQHYELCYWKETAKRINYRRFFTVNSLICLNMEDKSVMHKHHDFLGKLIEKEFFQGLRVDHIDGLRDPAGYLRELRSMMGEEGYIVVEKILEPGEKMPGNWPVEGSSGYDFLSLTNNLLIQKKNYRKLRKFYHQFTGDTVSPEEMIYRNKKLILNDHMRGEWDNVFALYEKLLMYSEQKGYSHLNGIRNIPEENLKEALGEFMIAFPVYRLYPESYPLRGNDKTHVEKILREAIKRNPVNRNALQFFGDMVIKDKKNDREYNRLLENFFGRLMQFTGPLTAKGVEDTSMYQYSCFIAGNEVGDSLLLNGLGVDQFHEAMTLRLQEIPLSMNGTSTHDTKRGEDVRARLNAIGDLPDQWIRLVKEWEIINSRLKNGTSPTAGEEYFIYQTIAGTYPFGSDAGKEYKTRIKEYLVKALREAKQNTTWEEPDEQYETSVVNFALSILDEGSAFLQSFLPFHNKLSWRGIVNSLAQLTIKCFSPGIPDIYRGSEQWDFSMVDPDNRRPVDYKILHKELIKIRLEWKQNPADTLTELYKNAADGRIKLLLTSIFLYERKINPDLYLHGEYIPLTTTGKYERNIIGFARRHKGYWLMCILPLYTGSITSGKGPDSFFSIKWADTQVVLPEGAPRIWHDILSGREIKLENHGSTVELFRELPVVILKGKMEPSERKSGILLHVTSLPGNYGIGDMGEEAYRFIDFLSRTGQKYWQTLPLTPITKSQSWSPYSSPSAFAGNTLLTDPLQLYNEGLITSEDLDQVKFAAKDRVSYDRAGKFRDDLLEKSIETLKKDTGSNIYLEYKKFCTRESYWLDDYSLFIAYKQKYGQKDWSRWPSGVKNRDQKTLKTARYELAGSIRSEKFKQFIFDRQWKKLKNYANNKGISIFGDIPFYVGYDSADVWANQHLYNLNEKGKMNTVAGVPPDYFDKNGQLWNMPVYNWDWLKKSSYEWWINRLTRNLELFDQLRLDHFRAFSAFWGVPANDKTAINGEWCKGPGSDFFNSLLAKFPSMPFVAEDLGDINQDVYDLRDQFSLPGMRVLQFSFDREMAFNIHTPHNHSYNSLVYTGTHDNNTIRGWYERELDKDGRKRLQEYAGKKIKTSGLPVEMVRMALASPARTAIIPMQDYLSLGRESRMNTPSTSKGNWLWKMKDPLQYKGIEEMIRKYTIMYNRNNYSV